MTYGLLVLLAVLAAYRIARMIAMEDGPFDAFSRLQERAGGNKTWVGRGLACPLCVSFWVALAAAGLVGAQDWRGFVLLWGGIAGGAVLLHKVVG